MSPPEEDNPKKSRKIVAKNLKITDKSLVTKRNELVEARYKLTLDEQRLFLSLVSRIEPDDTEQPYYQLSSREMIRVLGWENDNNAYTRLRNLVRKLQTKLVYIKLPNGRYLEAQFLGPADHGGEHASPGMIEFEISRKLYPYLLQIKGEFTKYRLKHVFQLQSAHVIRIYELLKQYQNIGNRTMSLNELRLTLGIEKLKSYRVYGNIKKRIILPAQEELAKKTDITFSFEENRTGQKVTGLRFIIRKNIEKGDLFPTPMSEQIPSVVKQLVAAGMAERVVKRIWRQKWDFLDETARSKLEPTDERDFSQLVLEKLELFRVASTKGKVSSPGGWLSDAIKFNWPEARNIKMKKPSAERSGRGQPIREVLEGQAVDKNTESPKRFRDLRLDSEYMALSPGDQRSMNEDVINELLGNADLIDYRNEISRVAEENDFGTGIYTELPAGLRVIATSIRRKLIDKLVSA